MTQLPDAVNVLPQVLLWLKLDALVPVIEMPVMFSVALPVLVNVTGCAVAVAPTYMLGNETEERLRLATGAGELDELDPLPPHPVIPAIATIPTIAATMPLPATRLDLRSIRDVNSYAFPRSDQHNDMGNTRPIHEEDKLFTGTLLTRYKVSRAIVTKTRKNV